MRYVLSLQSLFSCFTHSKILYKNQRNLGLLVKIFIAGYIMSSPSKDTELKAGHPPAAKAGGMRIAAKHHHSAQPSQPLTQEEKEEQEEFIEPKERDQSKIIISGVVTKGNADFPPAAAKVAHDKPMAQLDKRPPAAGAKGPQMHIHQPRKQ